MQQRNDVPLPLPTGSETAL